MLFARLLLHAPPEVHGKHGEVSALSPAVEGRERQAQLRFGDANLLRRLPVPDVHANLEGEHLEALFAYVDAAP